jgi:hypothetical protein
MVATSNRVIMVGRRAMYGLVAVAVAVLSSPATAHAQRFVNAEASAGGAVLFTGSSPAGGWYADAMKSLLPGTAVVAEVMGAYSPEREPSGSKRWFAVLGGIRQTVVRRPRARVFAQLLLGAGRYTQRFSHVPRFTNSLPVAVLQPGLGADMALNDRWTVRVRMDLHILGHNGELFTGGCVLGAGVARYWGRR